MPRRTRSLKSLVVCICDIIDIPIHISSHHLISYIQDYLCNSQLIQGRAGSQLRFGSRFANSFLVTAGNPVDHWYFFVSSTSDLCSHLEMSSCINLAMLVTTCNSWHSFKSFLKCESPMMLQDAGKVLRFFGNHFEFGQKSSQAARYELLEARLSAGGGSVRCCPQGFTGAFSWYSSCVIR